MSQRQHTRAPATQKMNCAQNVCRRQTIITTKHHDAGLKPPDSNQNAHTKRLS